MEKLIHLKDDLGINKSVIVKSYENDGEHLSPNEHTERGFDEVRDLLNRRTQRYTVDECRVLVECYLSSHDFCVIDNHYDFPPIEVYQANQKWDRYDKAMKKLEEYLELSK
jgi:hypothetical protein